MTGGLSGEDGIEHEADDTDVGRARAGDELAFERIYVRHAPEMFRLARWLLSTGDVEDVVQDVFVRAWTRLDSLDRDSSFRPWLRRLATNVILRWREREGRRADHTTPLVHEHAIPVEATDIERVELERAVARLPRRARDVFVLYDVEGLTHGEIASALAIAEATSRSQLSRARLLLRRSLG